MINSVVDAYSKVQTDLAISHVLLPYRSRDEVDALLLHKADQADLASAVANISQLQLSLWLPRLRRATCSLRAWLTSALRPPSPA